MPRTRDTLERRKRRFLLPLLKYTFPALVMLIALEKISGAVCDLLFRLAPAGTCSFSIPDIALYTIGTFGAAGVAGSMWRFYKDYFCHERFDGLF